jgi:hypothetical protein
MQMISSTSLHQVHDIERRRLNKKIRFIFRQLGKSEIQLDRFRSDAELFLLQQARPPVLSTQPTDALLGLPLERVTEIYWQELDQIIDWVRACIFNLMHARTVGIVDSFNNLVVTAMQLRQLIEVSIWAIYYQFVQTTAFHIINRMGTRGDLRKGIYLCNTLEEFVRGALAPDPERTEGIQRILSVGGESTRVPEDYATEIRAAFVKQISVVRHVAGTFDKIEGTNTTRSVDIAERGYDLCCGLVHPTPLLFKVSEGWGDRRVVEKSIQDSVLEILCASHLLATNLYFHRSFESVKFWPIFQKLLPSLGNAEQIDLKIPDLDDMKKVYSTIAFNMSDGTTTVIFDRNKRKK